MLIVDYSRFLRFDLTVQMAIVRIRCFNKPARREFTCLIDSPVAAVLREKNKDGRIFGRGYRKKFWARAAIC
jgi:hypothetical protein